MHNSVNAPRCDCFINAAQYGHRRFTEDFKLTLLRSRFAFIFIHQVHMMLKDLASFVC